MIRASENYLRAMKIPRKITPCPILEAVLEIRFESDLPEDAIFGIIYNKFKNEYSHFEKLPVLQIPEAFRSKDPNLMFSPHYKLQESNFLLQIGPKVFSLVNIKEYSGWDVFSQKIEETFSAILVELEVVKKITKVGLRYINLFHEFNIYDKSTLKITLNDNPLNANQMNLTTEIPSDNCINQLRILNSAEVRIGQNVLKGSIIDIDTVALQFSANSFENLKDIIEKAHIEEKKLFFSLLTPDFIQTLHPVY